jgi:hypothetical protein
LAKAFFFLSLPLALANGTNKVRLSGFSQNRQAGYLAEAPICLTTNPLAKANGNEFFLIAKFFDQTWTPSIG